MAPAQGMDNNLMGMSDIELKENNPFGASLWREVAKRSPRILLAFSRGKDSIASMIELKKSGLFKEIILFYKYRIPNLEFVEDSLKYFENFFDQEIHRLPHPALYRMLRAYAFQPPYNVNYIYDCNLPTFDHDVVANELKTDLKLPPETLVATGIRAHDSLSRRTAIYQSGVIHKKGKTFYPIWDYSTKKTFEVIEESGCKLPVDYDLFGRSFDGINYQFLKPIKEHFPEDYKKILSFFPLAEVELKRIEFYTRNKKNG